MSGDVDVKQCASTGSSGMAVFDGYLHKLSLIGLVELVVHTVS